MDNKVSHTALPLVHLRHVEGIENADTIWNALSGEAEMDANNPVNTDFDLKVALAGRFRMMSKMLDDSNIRRVAEFACGFSPRGITKAAKDANVQYVDSDFPDVIAVRNRIIPAQGKNYATVGGSAFDRKTFENVARQLAGSAKTGDRVAIITEGLLRYVPNADKDILAENVRWLMNEFGGGIWLTDCIAKADYSNAAGCVAYNKMAGTADTCFETPEVLAQFANQHGFSSRVADWSAVQNDIVHAKLHNLSPEYLAQIIDRQRGTLIAEFEPQ